VKLNEGARDTGERGAAQHVEPSVRRIYGVKSGSDDILLVGVNSASSRRVLRSARVIRLVGLLVVLVLLSQPRLMIRMCRVPGADLDVGVRPRLDLELLGHRSSRLSRKDGIRRGSRSPAKPPCQ
jgi:hypothetical protein